MRARPLPGQPSASTGTYARLLAYIDAQALTPAGFSRELTMIDYGLTSDPEKFVTEITIPVHSSK